MSRRNKQEGVDPRVTRMLALSDAIHGRGDLKVGPNTIAEALIDAASYIESLKDKNGRLRDQLYACRKFNKAQALPNGEL